MGKLSWLLLLATAGCSLRAAGVPGAPASTPASEPISLSMVLIGRYGLAHACPVDGRIGTAAHVAVDESPLGTVSQRGYVYSQGPRAGFLAGYAPLDSRDLALMAVQAGDAPLYASRAETGPTVGEKVYWSEFNLTSHPMRQEVQYGKVTEVGPGHFAFEPEPKPGASGGCVFSEDGKVYGIVIWGLGYGMSPSGVAASLVGQWWPR